MSDDPSNLEKALAAERAHHKQWRQIAQHNRREVARLYKEIRKARRSLETAESKNRHLESEIARLVAHAPVAGLTHEDQKHRDAILALAATEGRDVIVTWPGEALEDSEGRPLGVTMTTQQSATGTGITITPDEARRYQIPIDTPGVRIATPDSYGETA